MTDARWVKAVAELGRMRDAAQAAAAGVQAAKAQAVARRPAHLDALRETDPAAYDLQLTAYAHSPQHRAAARGVAAAVARSTAYDRALLKGARTLLERRALGRRPPRRMPRAQVLHGQAAPDWWVRLVTRSAMGIWKEIPAPGPESRVGASDGGLVQDVAVQARLLQASLTGVCSPRSCLTSLSLESLDGRRGFLTVRSHPLRLRLVGLAWVRHRALSRRPRTGR